MAYETSPPRADLARQTGANARSIAPPAPGASPGMSIPSGMDLYIEFLEQKRNAEILSSLALQAPIQAAGDGSHPYFLVLIRQKTIHDAAASAYTESLLAIQAVIAGQPMPSIESRRLGATGRPPPGQ